MSHTNMEFETQKETKEDDDDAVAAVDKSGVGADAMSLDRDVEAVVWSDDPEKMYFKQMMEANTMSRVADGKDMDDSLLGINTVNSFLKDSDSWNGAGDGMGPPVGAPPQDFSIVAIEDDLSTIAGDTVNGNILDVPKPVNPANPRTRDFKEYTPTKKKKQSDSDEDTQPETPPGMIRVTKGHPPKKPGFEESDDEDEIDPDDLRTRRIYVMAAVLAVILIASIGALSTSLVRLRARNAEVAASAAASSNGNLPPIDDPFAPDLATLSPGMQTKKPLPAPALSPTKAPISAPTDAPKGAKNPATDPPIAPSVPTSAVGDASTVAPTVSSSTLMTTTVPVPQQATIAPTTEAQGNIEIDPRANLRTILATVSPQSLNLVDDVDTVHYQAYEWMVNDPDYFVYGQERVLQRWVLAIFFLSVSDGDGGGGGGNKQRQNELNAFFDIDTFKPSKLLKDWMTYTNECTWYSSRPNFVCNINNLVRSIDIREGDLVGTLPSELSLLSNSLEIIFLSDNQFGGTIPTSYGKLTKLERFKMTTNNLVGEIPTEIGNMESLIVLGLGRNNLVGTLPTELGELLNLHNIGLEGNFLTGTIPIEFGELWLLRSLVLEQNELTGTIPEVLGALGDLTSLGLSNNKFVGDIPKEVCKLNEKASLESISADCYIGCECCTYCEPADAAAIVTPASAPTMAPALSGFTNQPTPCTNMIYTHLECYEPNERILASFINCNPQQDDWIGLLQSNVADLNEAVVWMWSCGTQDCTRERIGADTVEFNWPLNVGEYRVHMIGRNPGENYASIASSGLFTVANNCNR